MTIIREPRIDTRSEQLYMGIRTVAPFSGMSSVITRISKDMEFDRWQTEQGDNFRCRYESYLTDPRIEHRKSHWEIEVAIKLADEHNKACKE